MWVVRKWHLTHICCAEDEAADEPPRNAALVLLRGLAAAADTPEMATSAAPEVRRVQLVSLLCFPVSAVIPVLYLPLSGRPSNTSRARALHPKYGACSWSICPLVSGPKFRIPLAAPSVSI
jgi:hypothetical protein